MTADELKQAGRALFGYGWQTRLADTLGVDGSTVRRWVSSGLPVAGSAAALLDALANRQRVRGALAFETRRDEVVAVPEGITIGSAASMKDDRAGTDFRMPHIAFTSDPSVAHDVVVMRHPDEWHREGYQQAMALRHTDVRSAVADAAEAILSISARKTMLEVPIVLYQDALRDGTILSASTPQRLRTDVRED